MLTRFMLIGIIIPCFSILSSAQMSFSEWYLESLQRAELYTLDMVQRMPEDKLDFKPVPEVATFHDQVIHMIKNVGFLQGYLTGSRENPIRDLQLQNNSRQELIQNLKVAFEYLETVVKNMEEEELYQMTSFFEKSVKMDKRAILLLIKNHLTLHQGQLVVYLRLNGITPPRFNGY